MKINWLQVIGVALLLLGLIWIVYERVTDEDAPETPDGPVAGETVPAE